MSRHPIFYQYTPLLHIHNIPYQIPYWHTLLTLPIDTRLLLGVVVISGSVAVGSSHRFASSTMDSMALLQVNLDSIHCLLLFYPLLFLLCCSHFPMSPTSLTYNWTAMCQNPHQSLQHLIIQPQLTWFSLSHCTLLSPFFQHVGIGAVAFVAFCAITLWNIHQTGVLTINLPFFPKKKTN